MISVALSNQTTSAILALVPPPPGTLGIDAARSVLPGKEQTAGGEVHIEVRVLTAQKEWWVTLGQEADWAGKARYRPRTALWKRLLEIRSRIIASGQPLLDWDGLDKEAAQRRGGEHEEGDLR